MKVALAGSATLTRFTEGILRDGLRACGCDVLSQENGADFGIIQIHGAPASRKADLEIIRNLPKTVSHLTGCIILLHRPDEISELLLPEADTICGMTQRTFAELNWASTGYKVSPTRIAGVFGGAAFRYTYPNGHKVEYLVTLIECEVIEQVAASDNEISEMKYFAEDDMPKIVLPYPLEGLYGHISGCVGN